MTCEVDHAQVGRGEKLGFREGPSGQVPDYLERANSSKIARRLNERSSCRNPKGYVTLIDAKYPKAATCLFTGVEYPS